MWWPWVEHFRPFLLVTKILEWGTKWIRNFPCPKSTLLVKNLISFLQSIFRCWKTLRCSKTNQNQALKHTYLKNLHSRYKETHHKAIKIQKIFRNISEGLKNLFFFFSCSAIWIVSINYVFNGFKCSKNCLS